MSEVVEQMFGKVSKQQERVRKEKEDGGQFVKLSDQPYSKWQAIFHLEEIKERNKPILPKKDLPKAPFFLFDLDKVMAGESNVVPDDLLKQTFFTQEKTQENKLAKHGFQRQLRKKLKEVSAELGSAEFEKQAASIISYLKTLSPSGIELEFLNLASFEFDDAVKGRGEKLVGPTELVSTFFISMIACDCFERLTKLFNLDKANGRSACERT